MNLTGDIYFVVTLETKEIEPFISLQEVAANIKEKYSLVYYRMKREEMNMTHFGEGENRVLVFRFDSLAHVQGDALALIESLEKEMLELRSQVVFLDRIQRMATAVMEEQGQEIAGK